MKFQDLEFETRAIYAGQQPDKLTGAVVTPITLATTFVQESPGQHTGYEYARSGNPTRTAYETCLANLESGNYGFAFASGCAALTSLLHLFKTGDHIISKGNIYGGSARLIEQFVKNQGLQADFVDLSDIQKFENAICENTKCVWIETPSNPTLKLVDIEKISQIASKRNILVAVDNTFMSPFFQRPLLLGADISYHSTSKYIGGHSDVIGGFIAVKDKELAERLYSLQNDLGAVASPFDSFMCLRSLKTLGVRMKAHEFNAQKVAQFLESHPKIEKVIYPGLKSHLQYDLAKKQMSGFGGMISFYIKGGLKEAKLFLSRLKIFNLAESLGGVESLIEHPAIMTHAYFSEETRQKFEITDNFIRVSVGIEHLQDLINDLDQALT